MDHSVEISCADCGSLTIVEIDHWKQIVECPRCGHSQIVKESNVNSDLGLPLGRIPNADGSYNDLLFGSTSTTYKG